MIYPFTSDNGILLSDRYSLDVGIIDKIKKELTYKEKREFIRIYITEGIPYAFKKNPLIFEDIRTWIGKHLSVEPKNITITGSSRVGFSLNPRKWGHLYQNGSDLDFIIISKKIFEEYKNDFKMFVGDIQFRLKNRKKIEAIELSNIDNIYHTTTNLGFIDQWKIPCNKKYATIYKSYDVLLHLVKRMKITSICPQPYKATIRVYKDWQSCIEQLIKSFH